MNARHMTRVLAVVILIVLGLGEMGCAQWRSTPPVAAEDDLNLIISSYQAADALLTQAPWLKQQRRPLLTATFVNVNSLETSSGLGRMVAEQVAARFVQKGFTVIEMKLRGEIFVKENAGEFVLSRSVNAISQAHNVAAVITGTYAVGRNSIYVNARLIRAADSLVLAAYDYTLPMAPDTRALLAGQ